MRSILLSIVAIFTAALMPASAQIAGENLPDMKSLQEVFGGLASGEINVDPIVDANGLIGSGISVRDTGAHGSMAKAIAEPFGAAVGDPTVTVELERAFIQAVTEVEAALPQLGFQQRDYGVAFALFFIMNWELANDAQLPTEVSMLAGEKLIQAISAAYPGDTGMTDAELDQQYDMFLTIPVAILAMVQSFEAAGGTAEAAQMREYAGQAFEQVIGISPYDIDITSTGEIRGY